MLIAPKWLKIITPLKFGMRAPGTVLTRPWKSFFFNWAWSVSRDT